MPEKKQGDDVAQQQNQQQAEAAENAVAAEEKRLDETEPGGRYEVGGQVVDANGKPLMGEK